MTNHSVAMAKALLRKFRQRPLPLFFIASVNCDVELFISTAIEKLTP